MIWAKRNTILMPLAIRCSEVTANICPPLARFVSGKWAKKRENQELAGKAVLKHNFHSINNLRGICWRRGSELNRRIKVLQTFWHDQ